jgi:PAS domain-containing protein
MIVLHSQILQTENLTVSFVWKDNGEPLYLITVVEDITERKLAEDRLELLIEQTRDGFYILDYYGFGI